MALQRPCRNICLAALLAGLANSPCLAQAAAEIQEIAAQLAERVERTKARGNKGGPPEVLVMPFPFSERIGSAMAALSGRYRMGGADCVARLLTELKLAEGMHLQAPVAAWLGKQCGVDLVVTVDHAVEKNEVKLRFAILRPKDGKELSDFRKNLPRSGEQFALADKTQDAVKLKLAPSGQSPGVQRAGRDSVGIPTCLYCPHPRFTDDAVRAKGFPGGTVILRVVITAEGLPRDIQLVRGLPFGLTEKAIAAVQSWKLKPALGPDAKPVAVWVHIEVLFRQY